MKKITAIFAVIGLIAISAYFYMRYSVSTPGFEPVQAKETSTLPKPAESALDLRPKLIEKIQHLVKQGSNGLYNLFIHEANPDLLNSTIVISRISLLPDTVAMKALETSKMLPDEIFKIKADSVRIEGVGLNDIISKDVLDIKAVHILQPAIEVYSNKRSYNKKESKTLYQRLMNQMKHIGIGDVIIENGTLTLHRLQKNKSTKLNDISIRLSDILIDSTTQFDKDRFLFAKQAQLRFSNYSLPTTNNLYTFKIGTVWVNATEQRLTASQIYLQPKYSKTEFQKINREQKERYAIGIPSIELRDADWWQLINNETLVAGSATLNKASINVYLDRRLQESQRKLFSFPHQLIMKLPLRIKINKLNVSGLDVVYEEYSKLSGKPGKVYMTNLRGSVSNLTNIPEAIRQNKTTTVKASGVFMHTAPIDLTLQFDLANYKSGVFTAHLETKKGFDGSRINVIAEPLGMFRVKSGQLDKLVSTMSGNNSSASGNITMLYKDLHIDLLEKDKNNPGVLDKKDVTGFIANTFVIKDENPSGNGEVRKEAATFQGGSGTFFNLIWKTTFTGILKTIGAPERLALPK